jgi:hypothetical protein
MRDTFKVLCAAAILVAACGGSSSKTPGDAAADHRLADSALAVDTSTPADTASPADSHTPDGGAPLDGAKGDGAVPPTADGPAGDVVLGDRAPSDGAAPDAAMADAPSPPLLIDAAPPCTENDTRCNPAARTSEVCTAGAWVKTADCPFLCAAGACTGECVPGQRECNNLTPRSCDGTAHWIGLSACQANCTDGVCTGSCTDGSKQCGSNQTPQTCTGGAWVDGTACPFVCGGAGVCGGGCTPGMNRCNGTTGESCDGSGTWQPSGADCTAPTVVNTVPASGEGGVHDDARIVITFSEPMDRAATEAAFTSGDLPAHTFSWDAAGRILTVTLTDPLLYADVADLSGAARSYSFSVSVGAGDQAGNKLAQPLSISFTTLRRLTSVAPVIPAMSATIEENSNVHTLDGFVYTNCAGTKYPSEARIFLSFDIHNLPAGIARFEAVSVSAADLMLDADQVFPTAPLQLAQVRFAALDAMTFFEQGDDVATLVKGTGKLWTASLGTLRDAFAGEYGTRAGNNDRVQYSVRIDAPTCDNRASFELPVNTTVDQPALSVTYLIR